MRLNERKLVKISNMEQLTIVQSRVFGAAEKPILQFVCVYNEIPKSSSYTCSTAIFRIIRNAENFVASHLLKAVHFWTVSGFGQYHLPCIRDKDQREVDFLVTRNEEPWWLKSKYLTTKQFLRH